MTVKGAPAAAWSTRVKPVPVAAAGIAYLALHLVTSVGRGHEFVDTRTYFPVSFLGHAHRTWTVPVLYWLAPGHDSTVIVVLQTVLAAVCWAALAWQLASTMRNRWVALAAALVVLSIGLAEKVAMWNSILLSESACISLLVALLAASLRLLRPHSGRHLAVWAVVFVLWMFTRQLNLLLCIPFVLVAGIAAAVTRRRVALVIAGVALATTVWSVPFVTSSRNLTAESNRLEVLSLRVSHDPALLAYFESKGLPDADRLKAQPEPFGATSPLWQDRKLRDWAREHFVSTYASYAVKHPVWALTEPLHGATDRLLYTPTRAHRYRRVLPAPLDWLLTGPLVPFGAALLAAGGLFLAAWRTRGFDRRLLLPVAVLAGAGLLLLAVWHLSVQDSVRLNLADAVAMRVAVFMVLLWSLDRLLSRTTAVWA